MQLPLLASVMEFGLKELLFGIAGVSMILWVALIGLWHTYMFPRFFKEDSLINASSQSVLGTSANQASPSDSSKPWFINDEGNSLNPQTGETAIGLNDRNTYSKRSFVVANFSPLEPGYGVNRLYTSVLLGLAISTFVIITHGLQSGFGLLGASL